MSTPTAAAPENRRTMACAIALAVLVGVGLSALNSLVSITLERQGVSAALSGATAAAAGVGTVTVVAAMPILTRGLGMVGVLGLAIALATGLTLLYPLAASLSAWMLLRFLMGVALGAIFTLSEFWISVSASQQRRGTIMGLYSTMLYTGFALGPLMVSLLAGRDGDSLVPWFTTAALMATGFIPLFAARDAAPPMDPHGPASPWRAIAAAPAATCGAFVFGAIETGAMLLLPVHGIRLGLSVQGAASLVSAFTLGNVLLQIPLGLTSDRLPRMPMLASVALLGALALLALLSVHTFWLTLGLLFLGGGVSGSIYPLSLTIIGESFTDKELVAANGAVVVLYSLGMMIGPPLIGVTVDGLGTSGLPLALGTILALYGLGIALGIRPGRKKDTVRT